MPVNLTTADSKTKFSARMSTTTIIVIPLAQVSIHILISQIVVVQEMPMRKLMICTHEIICTTTPAGIR